MFQNKTIGILLFCYFFWGFQPLYWVLFRDTDPMFLLASRVIWAAVFVLAILAVQGRLHRIKEVFRDRELMWKHLIPATIFTMVDWTIYMWAVLSGYVLDCSLGYYISPLVLMLIGIVVFHEKFRWQSIAAVCFVIAGIGVSAIGFKVFPFVTVSLAFAFSIYAAFMKDVKIDSILSTGVQLLMMAPIAILFILFFRTGDNGLASASLTKHLLLAGAGVVTATPILLYANCVRKLPLMLMSILQYLSPTFGLFSGLLLGETLTKAKLISFVFIWAGILVYSLALIFAPKQNDRADRSAL